MGNRVIQFKVIKLKRQRRLFPKKYASEYIPVSTSGISKHVIKEGADRATSGQATLFMRGTTSREEAELQARNAYIQAMWPEYCIVPISGEMGKANEPRRLVKKLIAKIFDDVAPDKSVLLSKSTFHEERMFWNSSLYYLVFTDYLHDTVSKSYAFGSRQQLMIARKRGIRRWKTTMSMKDTGDGR